MIASAAASLVAAQESLRIGMPELCRAGLSEGWMWKAAGHRHWLALAEAHGLDRPDFRDATGARLYAAFTGVTLEDGRLDQVAEHDQLAFAVTLSRTGRSRFRSTVTLSVEDETVARLTLDSAFVGRREAGRNRSATRGLVARPCRLLPPADPQPPFRAQGWEQQGAFRREERKDLARLTLDPNPHEDFNGADFLYFAAFPALIDRAEWAWFRRLDPPLTTHARRIAYLGNIELGDRVTAVLCGVHAVDAAVSHWIELRREDDSLIAIAFTDRLPAQRAPAG